MKFFALAKSDNSLIVSADTRDALNTKIEEIRRQHPAFYKKHILAGYFIVEAADVRHARAAKKKPSFDLPLFRVSDDLYVATIDCPDEEEPERWECQSMDEALDLFEERPAVTGTICYTTRGELVKKYDTRQIRDEIEARIVRRKKNRKQLKLF